jgi:hypothetical protein
MTKADRLRHLYVIGQTGTGKTTVMKNMIIDDIKAGEGCCFIDPHGSDVQDILANIPKERIDDVIYFDPSYMPRPFGLNLLEYDINKPEQKIFLVNELFSIFKKLYASSPESMGPAFEQYFRNATMLVMEDPETGNTMIDIMRVMADANFRNLKLSRCKNPIVVQFWRDIATKTTGEAGLQNMIPYIVNKFDVFISNDIMRPVIAQEKSSFNFRELMDNKKILLVNLSKGKLGEMNANLLGMIIVGKIFLAAMSRVDAYGGPKLPDFYLYIDEFQNISTPSIAGILSEARKYGLSLNIAHQYIAQLDDDIKDAVFGNVGSMAVYRVSAENAEYLESQFKPTFVADDLMKIESYNAYFKPLINGKPVTPFNISVPNSPKGVTQIVEQLKELSYIKYGRDRKTVDDAILKKYQSTSAANQQAQQKPQAAPVRPVAQAVPQVPVVPPPRPLPQVAMTTPQPQSDPALYPQIGQVAQPPYPYPQPPQQMHPGYSQVPPQYAMPQMPMYPPPAQMMSQHGVPPPVYMPYGAQAPYMYPPVHPAQGVYPPPSAYMQQPPPGQSYYPAQQGGVAPQNLPTSNGEVSTNPNGGQ